MDAHTRDAYGWAGGAVIAVALFSAVCVGVVMTSEDNLQKRKAALEACVSTELPASERIDCIQAVLDPLSAEADR